MNNINFDRGLSNREFSQLGSFIEEKTGIRMPPEKRIMLQGRLRKRLMALGLDSYSRYIEYLLGPVGMAQELNHLFDAITTHKTEFFREPDHFQYLRDVALPRLVPAPPDLFHGPLTAWSAGCSTGEEAYTLAMVISEYFRTRPGAPPDFEVLGTDISPKALQTATRAVYDENRADPIPMDLRRTYLLKSKERSRGLVRIAPALRDHVKFRRLNFSETHYGFRKPMDIVFFRNVVIYFDRPHQEEVLKKIVRILRPGGYLFMGHSDTLLRMHLPLRQVETAVYIKCPDSET